MGPTRSHRCFGPALLLAVAAGASAGDETKTPALPPAASKAEAPATAKDEPSGEGPTRAEVDALRAETVKRLGALPDPKAKEATAADKALREVLEDRRRLLDDWEKAAEARSSAENPKVTPEKQAADDKADLERARAMLDQAARNAEVLLPVSFRNLPAKVDEEARAEMKEAIAGAEAELARLESAKAGPARKDGGPAAALRAERDKTFQKVNSLKARTLERATAPADPNAKASDLAAETQVNERWELKVETEHLRAEEALLDLENRRAAGGGLAAQVLEFRTKLAQQTLDGMKSRYRAIAAREEQDLHRAAAKEQRRASKVDDPLERYRARRSAELLELEARLVREQDLKATATPPTLEQQRGLAERATTEFNTIKQLLDDGRVSHLDAIRLNNDFRRVGAERARIVREDLAVTANRLTAAENALSSVELELIYDARDDRFELDTLLEHLPPTRQARARALFEEFEKRHVDLLNRRRDALEQLAARAEQTHDQVLRRLKILDDHFGFIRTNLFWVRDEEPLGPETVGLLRREGWQLAKAGLHLAQEVGQRSSWGRLSAEFLSAVLGLVVLPWPLSRAHRALLRTLAPKPSPVPPTPPSTPPTPGQ